MNILQTSFRKYFPISVLVALLILFVLISVPAFAQDEIDMNSVNALVSEVEQTLANSPAPPEGIDTEQALKAANELGVLEGTQGDFVVLGESEGEGDSDSVAAQDTVIYEEPNDSTLDNETELDPKVMSLGEPGKSKEPRKEVVSTKTQNRGSPGMHFTTYVQQISAQECMRRAKAAFESEGMTIGAGDSWWYGASLPKYHSYNNCIDIGNGNTIVNFTTASWKPDTLDHLNRLTSAYNATPGTLYNKPIYTKDVPFDIPKLYMWVQMKNMSQSECIKRGVKALKSEGLGILGTNEWWVGAQDGRFNTYVTCTDLGNGNVYINVTSTSSQSEDLTGHRDRITSQFN